MRRPTADELALLRPSERACFEIADKVHRTPWIQAAVLPFQRFFGAAWVKATTKNLRHIEGIEHVRDLAPDRGVIFVCNHRSFFDFYVVTAVLYESAPWLERIYFPVRSRFFYEGPLGVAVNAVMSGWAMFPPVVKSERRKAWNRYTTDFLVEALGVRGNVVGFHPEGARGTGPDPYELLPIQPGIGAILRRARPIVVPVFTLGLINHFPRQIYSNFDGSGAPVTIVFGAPLELEDCYAMEDGQEASRAIAERVRASLAALGDAEKALRARLGLPAAAGAGAPVAG